MTLYAMSAPKLLGKSALSYVRQALAEGDRLAQYLLTPKLESGVVYAFLPSEIDTVDLTDFSADIFNGTELDPRKHCLEPTFEFMGTYLDATPVNIAVWERWPEKQCAEPCWDDQLNHFWDLDGLWSVWDGPGGARSPSRTEYIALLGRHARPAEGFPWARPYPAVCVLAPFPAEFPQPARGAVVDRALLTALAMKKSAEF